jgi:hypothetical protein
MKKLLYFLVCFSLFLSCEKKKDDVTPVKTPVLKGFIVESTTPSLTAKSYYMLVSANGKLSNLQKIDSIKQDEKVTVYTNNNIITDGLPNNYSVLSDLVNPIGGSAQTSKIDYSAKKVSNGYEIIIPFSPSLSSYVLIELNADNQMVKYSDTKIVVIDNNGMKRETLKNSYLRYEYDSKGNVVKVFQKQDGTTTETLATEYTYDTNPNPTKPLLWAFRLVGFGVSGAESNNNIVTSKNYQQGTLFTESIGLYTYDSSTKFPLTVNVSGKSYSPNVMVGTSKTTFKY